MFCFWILICFPSLLENQGVSHSHKTFRTSSRSMRNPWLGKIIGMIISLYMVACGVTTDTNRKYHKNHTPHHPNVQQKLSQNMFPQAFLQPLQVLLKAVPRTPIFRTQTNSAANPSTCRGGRKLSVLQDTLHKPGSGRIGFFWRGRFFLFF